MHRHIAIYKRYDTAIGLQQGKDYLITSQKEGAQQIKVTVLNQTGTTVPTLVYSSEWEFLQDWHILRTWKGKK